MSKRYWIIQQRKTHWITLNTPFMKGSYLKGFKWKMFVLFYTFIVSLLNSMCVQTEFWCFQWETAKWVQIFDLYYKYSTAGSENTNFISVAVCGNMYFDKVIFCSSLQLSIWRLEDIQPEDWQPSDRHSVWFHHPRSLLSLWLHAAQLLLWFSHQQQWLHGRVQDLPWVKWHGDSGGLRGEDRLINSRERWTE